MKRKRLHKHASLRLRLSPGHYLLIFGSVLFLLAMLELPDVYGFVLFPDEFGYWTPAAVLLKLDWSGAVSVGHYYSYGYAALLLPFLALIDEPFLRYRAACTLNLVLTCLVLWLLYRLLCTIEPRGNRKWYAVLAGVAAVYPAWIYYSQMTLSEIPIVTLYVLLCLLFALFLTGEGKGRIPAIVGLILTAAYLYAVHRRNIGIVLALVLCFAVACVRRLRAGRREEEQQTVEIEEEESGEDETGPDTEVEESIFTKARKLAEERAMKAAEENPEEDSEEGSDEENPEEDLEEGSEETSEEKLEEDPEEDTEENSEEDSKEGEDIAEEELDDSIDEDLIDLEDYDFDDPEDGPDDGFDDRYDDDAAADAYKAGRSALRRKESGGFRRLLPLFIAVPVICLLAVVIHFVRTRLVQGVYAGVSSDKMAISSYARQFEVFLQIFTVEGIRLFAESLAGKLLYMTAATYGLFWWGMGRCVRLIRRGGQLMPLYLFVFLASVANVLISAIFMLDPIRYDTLVYGRYNETLSPILIILGLLEILHHTRGGALVREGILLLLTGLMTFICERAATGYGWKSMHGQLAPGISYWIHDEVTGSVDNFPLYILQVSAFAVGLSLAVLLLVRLIRRFPRAPQLALLLILVQIGLGMQLQSHYTDAFNWFNVSDHKISEKLTQLGAAEEGSILYVYREGVSWPFIDTIQFQLKDIPVRVSTELSSCEGQPYVIVDLEDPRRETDEILKSYDKQLETAHFCLYYNRETNTKGPDT